MYLVMLGPPGAGKGTQAKNLSRSLEISHISTGDIFREQIQNKTPLGLRVKGIIDGGNLVDDDTTEAIVEARLRKDDAGRGFILDGFPRNLHQARWLDRFLEGKRLRLDGVIDLEVPAEEIIRRLAARRSCENCGRIFNLVTSPPKSPGICDSCNHELHLRDDDREEVIRKRLEVYERETAPLLEYYRSRDKLREVDGTLSPEGVLSEMGKVLEVRA